TRTRSIRRGSGHGTSEGWFVVRGGDPLLARVAASTSRQVAATAGGGQGRGGGEGRGKAGEGRGPSFGMLRKKHTSSGSWPTLMAHWSVTKNYRSAWPFWSLQSARVFFSRGHYGIRQRFTDFIIRRHSELPIVS